MIANQEYQVLMQGVRVLFLILAPVSIAAIVAGALAGSLQAATTIYDTAIGYTIRLVAVVVILYFFFPSFARATLTLAEMSFR